MLWVPEAALVPLQSPEAVQLVGDLVALQESVLLPPLLIVLGDKDIVTVGLVGTTTRATEPVVEPPALAQMRV